MSVDSTLKKEGIKEISKLSTLEINKIASNISEILTKAFPEHNLNKSDLFISICRLNMYRAEMPNDSAIAKYFYKNNSIYFSKNMNFNHINSIAVHECLHYMQEIKNDHGKLIRMGLYTPSVGGGSGVALNEAAVQHMASVATNSNLDTVKYYNMELSTESPDYYPIQTALLNEMIYFTGSYPLYHSTLYSNDVFKNTFIAKSSLKTYLQIERNFDEILEYENTLSKNVYKLSITAEEFKNIEKIKRLNSIIDDLKKIILEKTLETQNLIITNCFSNELNSVKTLKDVKEFQYKLYNFKHLIISTDNYMFFNQFYADIMNRLEERKQYILENGNITALDSITNELSKVREQTYGFRFFKNLFHKLKLLLEETIREKDY